MVMSFAYSAGLVQVRLLGRTLPVLDEEAEAGPRLNGQLLRESLLDDVGSVGGGSSSCNTFVTAGSAERRGMNQSP